MYTNEPPVVRAHVLCKACHRIRTESQILKWLSDPNRRENEFSPTAREYFYHSWTLNEILAAAAGGCHLCTLVYKQARQREVGDLTFPQIADTPGAIFVELASPGRGLSPLDMSFMIMDVTEKDVSPEDYSKLDTFLKSGREYDVPPLMFSRLSGGRQHGMVWHSLHPQLLSDF